MAKQANQAKPAAAWTPPLNFYFRVDFQRNNPKEHFQASFMEISGLNLKIETDEKSGNDGAYIRMPKKVSSGNITLKHPLAPLSESFTEWINQCFNYLESKNRNIKTYDMVIKLLGKNGKPLAGWVCRYAYPIQWDLDKLDATESGLSKETIVMACNRLKRITNIR